MNNGEYYVSKEDNYIGENKSFPAEIYKKPFEENLLGKEKAESGNEITTLQKKAKNPKNNADGSKKTLVDKVFNSVKSIATTATVAVTAIVVSNTVMSNTVSAELVDIDVGSSYVEYELQIADMGDEDECFVIVSASGEEIAQTEVRDNGIQKARIEGLKPEWEYTLSVVSRDGILGDIVRFKHKFQTLKHEEYKPLPPPDTYNGVYDVPSLEDAVTDWSKNQILIPVVFENTDGKYLYKISAFDIKGNKISVTEGYGSGSAAVKISDENELYSFVFEIYGVTESEQRLILSHDLGQLELIAPKVKVTDISVVGENLIRVDFTSRNTDGVSLRIEYADGVHDDLMLTPTEISRGYAEISVPETTASVSILPIVHANGFDIEQQRAEKTLLGELDLDVIVNLNNQIRSIELYVKAITNGATYIHVESSDQTLTGNYDIWDGRASIYFSERVPISFTAYLTDEDGSKLSNETQVSLDTAQPDSVPEYVFNYANVSDVAVTYNDDGTINVYLNTGFECAEEEYYYIVKLGRYIVRSKSPNFALERIPNETYSICYYYVCYERDGVEYALTTVTPSGMVNEAYHFGAYASMECTLTENELTISLDRYHNLDLSSIRLVSAEGEEITITESDFVSDGNGGYALSVTFSSVPEYVTVYAMVCPNPSAFDFIEDYEGSIYVPYETKIYPY